MRLRAPATLGDLAARLGGAVYPPSAAARVVARFASASDAGEGCLAPLLGLRYVAAAEAAAERGAALLVGADIASRIKDDRVARWVHPFATWTMAELLDTCDVPAPNAVVGEGTTLGEHVVLAPRVTIGARVRIDAGAVIGRPGFGWAFGAPGDPSAVRAVPQLGGVVIEDDVVIGPLCTIDAGTLAPTRIRRGAKLDAQVHVGHNVDIGEGTIIAAQSGFAGSVTVGRGVLIGGQVGVADHVTIGDGARVAAKSGVIGDIPAGAVVAGYPAVARLKWLRALARLYRGKDDRRSS